MSERFVTTSPVGSRDTLYERRNALSRDLLGDLETRDRPHGERAKRWQKRTPAARTISTGSLRVPELALGLVLVIGGALGASLLASKQNEKVEVVAAASDLRRGQIIAPKDLVAVELESQFAHSMTRATEARDLLGKYPIIDIPAGSPIIFGSIEARPKLIQGEEIVALQLGAGDVPASIAIGDSVRVVLVSDPTLAGDPAVSELEQPAMVWDVEYPSDQRPDYVVSLKVPTGFLAKAAIAERSKVALIGTEMTSAP